MSYKKIWDKTLSSDEKLEYEFSIGSRYRTLGIIVWSVLSLLLLFVGGLGVLVFLIALFYYGFYLKVANAYAFTDKRVLIHRGWLSTNTTSVDYHKITDVHIEEPLFDRLITKTGNIAINTAGSNAKEISLQHVELPYEVKKKLDALKDRAKV